MGVRKVEIRFCDACGKELIGRLTYRTCPCCGKDVCLACIEKENAKHKPRERKVKADKGKVEEMDEMPKPDLATFKIKTAEPGSLDNFYTLSLSGVSVSAMTLKEGITELMAAWGIDKQYVESEPESEGKRLLLERLN